VRAPSLTSEVKKKYKVSQVTADKPGRMGKNIHWNRFQAKENG